jgi:hypothetical protein
MKKIRSLLHETCLRFPQANMTSEHLESFANEWYRISRIVGLPRFAEGLGFACQSTSFFPVMADIMKHIPPSEGAACRREYCGNCEEGWVRVFDGFTEKGLPVDPEMGAVKRCPCVLTPTAANPTRRDEHFGRGYGEADVKWLWKRYQEAVAKNNGAKITTYQVNCMLDELDKKRGSSPAWRKVA